MADDKIQKVLARLQKVNRLMEDLIDSALEDDNRLSEDEKGILFGINSNLELYAKEIMKTIGDGRVDDEEIDTLSEIETKIITDAEDIAAKDQIISDDEKKLLSKLVKTIQEIGNM